MNIFYPIKHWISLFFSKFPLESLNSFFKFFISFTSYLFSYTFFIYYFLFPGILEFWCLVIVTVKFTVLYDNIYKKVVLWYSWQVFLRGRFSVEAALIISIFWFESFVCIYVVVEIEKGILKTILCHHKSSHWQLFYRNKRLLK